MSQSARLFFCVFFFTLTAFATQFTVEPATAQLRFPFQRAAKADSAERVEPNQLTESAGPWLIMCGSFSGDDRMHHARRLAEDLSANFDLPIYVYQHHFDVGQTLKNTRQSRAPQGPNVVDLSKPVKLASAGEFDQIAVLVGDFPDITDGRAQQTLAAIEKHRGPSNVSLQPNESPDVDASVSLRNAFLMPNPLLPETYFNDNTIDDEFVIKMNKRTKYSLFKNTGAYTVRVATFTGDKSMAGSSVAENLRQLNNENKFFKSRKSKRSDLETAFAKTRILAHHLREELNLDAYEFHDRNESYVCVGSFDWATRETVNGTEINPELKKVLKQFTGEVKGSGAGRVQLKSLKLPAKMLLAQIYCSGTPEVMAVPKAKSTSMASKIMGKLR